MDIILTINLGHNLKKNGLTQNIIFFALLLKKLNLNVLFCLNHEQSESFNKIDSIDCIDQKELLTKKQASFLIQVGWCVPSDILKAFKYNNPSSKIVHLHYGNRMMADIESCSTDEGSMTRNEIVDEIWLSPHFEDSISYFKTFYKNENVFIAPYIWDSMYLDTQIDIASQKGIDLFYTPGNQKYFAILEPNISVLKNCIPAIMALERLYQKDPSFFDGADVFCSHVISSKKYFIMLMNQLDIIKNNLVTFKGRSELSEIFGSNCNSLISHQLLCPLNYTYFECMYLGLPIVHNSIFLKECGFYYEGYDIEEASNAILSMNITYDKNILEHQSTYKKFLDKHSISSLDIQAQYRKILS
jgi:hypothetical protein